MKEANTSLSLSDLAKPRDSVFGRGQSDTVAEIADLPKLDVQGFFSETHITEGMGVLLRQVFDRLMGRSDQGVFRLKQAMGGGKTHNLLAAALLAQNASGRKSILQSIRVAADDRPIRVAAFSGRERIPRSIFGFHSSVCFDVNTAGNGRTRFRDPRRGPG